MEKDFNELLIEIISQLETVTYKGDLSDLGNEIGIVLGKYIGTNQDEIKSELENIVHGLRHGISLSNGTH